MKMNQATFIKAQARRFQKYEGLLYQTALSEEGEMVACV